MELDIDTSLHPRGRLRAWFTALCLALLVVAPRVHAVTLDPALLQAAKKEGEVNYYTTVIVPTLARPLAEAFTAKYGVKVNIIRADSQALLLRMMNEARGGLHNADVWHLTSGVGSLLAANLAQKFTLAGGQDFPPSYRDPNGNWVATNRYVLLPAVNTDQVAKADIPKTYADLLDPKWQGRMVWKPNDVSGAPVFIGAVLSSMGQDQGMAYLKRLAAQNIAVMDASARAILDAVIAGQYPMALQMFSYQAATSATKGAPVDWVRLSPATVTILAAGIVKDAPHPNAAKLFLEFVVSDEGQRIFRDNSYIPANPKIAPLDPHLTPEGGGFSATTLAPEKIDAGLDAWTRIYQALFK